MDQASLEPISVERNGIVLTGVGVTEDALAETMEARETPAEGDAPAPEGPPSAAQPSPETAPTQARNDQGQFAKPSRGQKRFDQLTKERETEKTAREAAEARAAEYEARIKALEERIPRPAETPKTADPAAVTAPSEPDFEKDYGSQVGTRYASYDAAIQAFQRDYAAFQTHQFDARFRTRIEADRASRDFQSHVEGVFATGRESYPDFDAVQRAGRTEFQGWQLDAILHAPDAAHLVYALAKNEQAASELAQVQHPVSFGLALGKVVTAAAVASPASTAPPVSHAPAPYQPVGSGSKTATPSLEELAARGDDFDASGYRERRRAERAAGRR